MADQFVVAFFGDGTLVVDAIGPYRSRERADAAADRLAAAIDNPDDWEDCSPSRVPQVVRLMSEADAVAGFAPPESGDSR